MKQKILLTIILIGGFLSPNLVHCADIKTGEIIRIDTAVNEDVYAAAQKVLVKAPIHGDLIGAAQEVRIEDSIYGDINAACEILFISGNLMDDARIAVRSFNLESAITGDLVVFSAESHIAPNARIKGDLVVFSGEVIIDGTIEGDLIVKGGKVILNGVVNGKASVNAGEFIMNGKIAGPAQLVANSIVLNNNAQLGGETKYWQEAGQLAQDNNNDQLLFDQTLARQIQEDKDWKFIPAGFAIWNILFGILAIIIFYFLFKRPTADASKYFISDSIKSIGFGLLYLLIIPVLGLLFIISIIGIPFGILIFILYLFTLLFAVILASLVITQSYKLKYNKHWNNWQTIGFAILTYLLLKLVMLIPVIGFLVITIVILATFGSFIMSRRRKKEVEAVG